jgi:hypothetical protein
VTLPITPFGRELCYVLVHPALHEKHFRTESHVSGYSRITVLAAQTGDSSGKISDIAVRSVLAACPKAGVNCNMKDASEGTNL